MPSYSFNHFTGRLKEVKHLQPLYPLSPLRLESSEPPKMIYDSIKTKPAMIAQTRASSSGATVPKKMLDIMTAMQRDTQYPVYKIRGAPDKILVGITTSLLFVSLGLSFNFLYHSAYPS